MSSRQQKREHSLLNYFWSYPLKNAYSKKDYTKVFTPLLLAHTIRLLLAAFGIVQGSSWTGSELCVFCIFLPKRSNKNSGSLFAFNGVRAWTKGGILFLTYWYFLFSGTTTNITVNRESFPRKLQREISLRLQHYIIKTYQSFFGRGGNMPS